MVLEETNNNKKTFIFRFGNGAWRDQQQEKKISQSGWIDHSLYEFTLNRQMKIAPVV